MRQKPINLRGTEATLRLQHQADRGGRRRLQAIQTVLNDMDGLMDQRSEHLTEALADRAAHAINRDGSRSCCKQHARARGRTARAGQSTDSCALKAKSLEQGLTKMPARQKRAADESAKTRRIRHSLSLRLCAVPPSDFQQLQVVLCCSSCVSAHRNGGLP